MDITTYPVPSSPGGTSSGPSALDKLLDVWVGYQAVKHQADLETTRTDANIPDRVDVATGAASPLAVAGAGWSWQTVALVAAAVVGGVVLLRAVR